MPPGPGDQFGRYELLELLGRGAMGEVYRALDTLLHRRVALKIVRPPDWAPEGPAPAEAAARILREARAAAQIAHPNAVAIYDVGEIEGLPFLAMELVAGKPLSAFVGDPTVPLERRIRWLAEIASALGAAHALGLVHRDVKPDNVMVGGGGSVKVLDFGIARRASASGDPATPAKGATALGTLTAAGVVLGTPFYMAPEQMRGEPFDGRADQFSWGVIAYELLTGEAPWDRSRGGVEVVSQILSREVDPPSTRNAEIPAAVDAAIQRAMRKAPAERFDSMEPIVRELEVFAEAPGSSVDPRPGTTPTRNPLPAATPVAPPAAATNAPGRASRASPRVVGGTVLALLLATAGVSRLALHGGSRPTPADAAPTTPLESRMSPNAEATASYLAGLQAQRDASMDVAQRELDRAIALDSTFAAAHLRRALLVDMDITPEMRTDLESARNSRTILGDHDRILLDALEPWMRAPPDLREAQRRLETAVASAPGDVDFTYELAWTIYHATDFARAASAFDAVIAQDPTSALAWYMKGRSQAQGSDDRQAAVGSYDRCLQVNPGATSCLEDLSLLQAAEGRCQDVADTSRRRIALAPEIARPYEDLAGALYCLGAPIETVRTVLRQESDHESPEARSLTATKHEESLALLQGDFERAERENAELDRAFAASSNDAFHFYITDDRMLMELELGRNAEVVRLGNDYLRRRPAWQANDLGLEPTIFVYSLEVLAGGLTRTDFVKVRGDWLARDESRVQRVGIFGANDALNRWAVSRMLTVATPEEAIAAIAARPSARPINALDPSPYLEERIGEAYLLGGRLDEAVAQLTRVSNTCSVLDFFVPVTSTRATLHLAEALQSRGDTKAACAAYRRVLDRWGKAKPASRTAASALARSKGLGCEP